MADGPPAGAAAPPVPHQAPPPPPNQDNTFEARRDCPANLQGNVGMYEPIINIPRQGDRTATGRQGPTVMGANTYSATIHKDEAKAIWKNLNRDVRNNPQNETQAQAFFRVGQIAEVRAMPRRLARYFDCRRLPTPRRYTWDISPGAPKFTSKTDSQKFIAFIANNQDPDAAVKIPMMTLYEIWEWHAAWLRCDKGYQRRADMTIGLRGTRMTRIDNVDQLRNVVVTSPTAALRRPAGHSISEADWQQNSIAGSPAARNLLSEFNST